jgi:hypothetical protein
MHTALYLIYRGDRAGAKLALTRAEAAYIDEETPASKWAKQLLEETRAGLSPGLDEATAREITQPAIRRLHAAACMTEEIHERAHATLPRPPDAGT